MKPHNITLQYLEKLAPSLPGPIYWKDRNSIYLGMNKFTLDACQLESFDNFIGKSDYDLWPQAAEELIKHDQEVIQTGKPIQRNESIISPTGQIKYFTVVKLPLRDDDGNIIGVIGNSIDITAQKEAERLKQESQEKFTRLANQVAHDIRSPLASLLMIVKSCEHIPEADRIALREAATSISDIANHLLHQYEKREFGLEETEERQAMLVSMALLEVLTAKKYQY